MSDSRNDGRLRVCLAPSVADITAPTLAEIAAGIDLECLMPMDGLQNFNPSTNKIKTRKMCSKVNTYQPGTVEFGDSALKLFKQVPLPDTVYDTLVYGYEGTLIVRWDKDADLAWAAGDEAKVYPVTCGEVSDETPEEDSFHLYMVPTLVSSTYEGRAVVAA